MGMSSTFLHHILTSILQTNEWKTLSPHLTDLQEEELLQVYETLQGSPFATQFQKVLRPIFEMQFIEHLKDLPKPVDERDSKKVTKLPIQSISLFLTLFLVCRE
ncbi:hypothetical protein HMI54_001826 [Coelomomyces lativittatus]|nr:hypothetical protein HMI56_007349 [Coelomomyces lativittatus]KAJ1510158.1 hypothetical protein HMI54_001826 [Coelomomyces lativittatus]